MTKTIDDRKQRLLFVLIVTVLSIAHLTLEFLTGGVRVHYPLMNEDLPALSNWWGLLVLPCLGWFAHRFAEHDFAGLFGLRIQSFYRLFFGMAWGIGLATAFELNLGQVPLYLLLGLLGTGLFVPLYRPELMLGFVIGMTYTFGAVIPTAVISLLALI